MKVLYNNSEIKKGIFLTPLETRLEPKVEYNAKSDGLYTLMLHDPDAVVGNYFHWLVVNIPGDNIKNGDVLFKYKGPAPPKGSGKHRYIFLLYEQSERINTHFSDRMMPMNKFYAKLNVNLQLVSRVYFISKYQDGGKTRKNRKKTKRIMKKRSKKHRKTSTFGKD
jgi:phosphatidylethanolamine-binding protein (PEBP) family uncharacterized protein